MMSCNEIDNEIQYMIYGPPLIFFIIYFLVCVHNNTRKWKNSKEMGKQGAPFTG